MRIAIVDTGVNIFHKDLIKARIKSYVFKAGCRKQVFINNDIIGHGTAICGVIYRHVPSAEFDMYQIFQNSDYIDERDLIDILEYFSENEKYDVLCLCLGIDSTNYLLELENVCEQINKKNTVIVASYNNIGSITYPAAFDNVIGVDWDVCCKNDNEFIICKGGSVQIYAKGMNQKLCWSGKQDYIVNAGASFATAHVCGIIANSFLKVKTWNYSSVMSYLEKKASKIISSNKFFSDVDYKSIEWGRIALFPYNKEIKGVVRFKDCINGRISHVFDIHESGNVGKSISNDMTVKNDEGDISIENIEKLNNFIDDIDTVVIGHLNEIEFYTRKDYRDKCYEFCLDNQKGIISFDTIVPEIKEKFKKISVPCYSVNIENIEYDHSGKIYRIGKPVVAVAGTESKQGKFTLQMELRREFVSRGFKVGQLCTEPQGSVLGADQVFPTGYASNLCFDEKQVIHMINHQLHCIEQKNPDIIITGLQSYCIWKGYNNTHAYPMMQNAIISAINPDVIILVINCYDDVDYIDRNIKYLESIVETDVLAIVLSFKDREKTWSPIDYNYRRINDEDILKYTKKIEQRTGKKCYYIDDYSRMVDEIIKYFSS